MLTKLDKEHKKTAKCKDSEVRMKKNHKCVKLDYANTRIPPFKESLSSNSKKCLVDFLKCKDLIEE